MSMFFDPRRYDLAKVGRYKFNKKLAFKKPYQQVRCWQRMWWIPTTGEILAEAGTDADKDLADGYPECGCTLCMDQGGRNASMKVLSNMMVDLDAYVDCRSERSWVSRN